jgi:mono/diheme cytochrome c family protein
MYLTLTPEIRPSESYNLFVFALPSNWKSASNALAAGPPAATVAKPTAAPVKCAHAAHPSSLRATTQDGVYTAVQSASGRALYKARQCNTCHGAAMEGTAVGPALAGAGFLDRWRGDTLGSLSSCIRNTMPPGAAGGLSDAEYRDLVAALLEANGFPASKTPERALPDTAISDVVVK